MNPVEGDLILYLGKALLQGVAQSGIYSQYLGAYGLQSILLLFQLSGIAAESAVGQLDMLGLNIGLFLAESKEIDTLLPFVDGGGEILIHPFLTEELTAAAEEVYLLSTTLLQTFDVGRIKLAPGFKGIDILLRCINGVEQPVLLSL